MTEESNIDISIQNDPYSYETLIRSIYTSPDIACIRELIRNAIDAHIESGNTDTKVDVSFSQEYFYVRDYGNGITPDMLKNLMSVLMKSGKRDKGTDGRVQTGQHGLGSKTPFGVLYAAKERNDDCIAFMTTIYNGTKDVYELVIKDDGMPSYTLVTREDTTEHSGVAYYIKLTNAMRNMSIRQFLTLFSVIKDDIQFIGYDYSKHIEVVNVGNYKAVLFIENTDDISMFDYKLTLRKVVSFENTNITDKLELVPNDSYNMIQYQDMLYPMPDFHYSRVDKDLREEFNDYLERYVNRESEVLWYNAIYLIVYDIGNESYDMQTTRSRDQLITENSRFNELQDTLENDVPKLSHKTYIHTCLISGLTEFKRYIENNPLEYQPLTFDNQDLYHNVLPKTMMDVFQAYIPMLDSFKEHVEYNGITNTLRVYERNCPHIKSFTYDDFIVALKYNDKINDSMGEHLEQVKRDTYASLMSMKHNVTVTFLEQQSVYFPIIKSVACSNDTTFKQSLKTIQYIMDSKGMEIVPHDIISYKNGEEIQHKSISIDCHNIDDYILLYKDSKTMKSKLSKFAEMNEGKIIVVYGSHPYINDNARTTTLINKNDFNAFKSFQLKLQLAYHSKYPLVFTSDLMPTIKVARKKREDKNKSDINVNNIKANARSVSMYYGNKHFERPTYEEIIELYNFTDNVYAMNDDTVEINESYLSHYNIRYVVDGGLYPRFSVYSRYDDGTYSCNAARSLSLNDLIGNCGVIILGSNVSQTLKDYVMNHTKTLSIESLMTRLIESVKRNDFTKVDDDNVFKQHNEPRDIGDIVNKNTLLHISKTWFNLIRDTKMGIPYNLQMLNRYDTPSINVLKYVADKHIMINGTLKDISGEVDKTVMADILFTMTENDISKVIEQTEYRKVKVDDLMQSYSDVELEFINMILTSLDKNKPDDPYNYIKRYESLYSF